jgi:predicted CoA-binding protein
MRFLARSCGPKQKIFPMEKNSMTVAVLGASPKPERYSNKAVMLLLEHGHRVIPVNPSGVEVCGIVSKKNLDEINEPVHTLSLYVNPQVSANLKDSIISLSPQRIIFNPGTENAELEELCADNGIEVIEACTLVMLKTGQFQD